MEHVTDRYYEQQLLFELTVMCYVIKILELNMSPGSLQVKNDASKDVFLTFESSQNVNDLKIYINTYTKILRKKGFFIFR